MKIASWAGITIIALAADAVSLLFQPALADEAAIVNAPDNKLNLRDGPNANSNIITVLPNNTKVHIADSFPNGWQKIFVDTFRDTGASPANQLSGFVNGKYLITASVMDTQAFRDGHADRQAFEIWFNDQSGPYRAGAEFWASHRSDPNPPDCSSTNDVAFRSGCEDAQKKLDESDRRRRADPDYKAGWNSPLDVDTSTNTAPSPAAPTQASAVLAQASSNNAVTITITRMVRFITPVNPIIELFTSTAGGTCNYYGTVDNHTPYHIINIAFRFMYSITDMRAMSHDADDHPMGYFTINAPMLRPDEDGNVHSGDQNYKITGTINGSYANCEAAARSFSDNLANDTFVTKCTMDGVTEGECLSFVHVSLADDFIDSAISVDKSNTWQNTNNNNRSMELP
jgi:hypothetical protein